MRARRRVVAIAAVAAVLTCAIGVACTFPDVTFAPAGSEAGAGEGGNPEGSSDSPTGDGMTDAGLSDAGPPLDGESEKPDTGACIDPCDCDRDGARTKDASCGMTGGTDCDDTDNRAKPGQTFLTDKATKDTKGDWNCDGNPERLIQNVNVDCGGTTDSCPAGKEGLRSDIPCGALGEYVYCKPGALNVGCVQVDSGFRTQECR